MNHVVVYCVMVHTMVYDLRLAFKSLSIINVFRVQDSGFSLRL